MNRCYTLKDGATLQGWQFHQKDKLLDADLLATDGLLTQRVNDALHRATSSQQVVEDGHVDILSVGLASAKIT